MLNKIKGGGLLKISRAIPPQSVGLNECLLLHGSVSVDFWHRESKTHIKLPQLFNHGALRMGAGLQSQSAKCSRQLLCGGWSVSLIL